MDIYLFQSTSDLAMFGFTSDPSGANLPHEFGPWSPSSLGAAPLYVLMERFNGTATSGAILKALADVGFFLGGSRNAFARKVH
jgi:hypothetical protein